MNSSTPRTTNRKFDESQGRNLGDSFLLLLLIVLVVEQWFAWSCGYHVSSRTTNPWSPKRGTRYSGSGQVEDRQVENLSYVGVKGGPA